MNTPPLVVTLGSVTVGLGILAWVLTRWWVEGGKSGRKIRTLLPYVFSALYGMLLILTGGGLLGSAAGWALWGTTTAGDAGLVYGVGSSAPEVTRTYADALTPGGSMVVILCTVILIAILKFARNIPKAVIILGLLTGISLGMADGVAGWAATALAPAANGIGAPLGGAQ